MDGVIADFAKGIHEITDRHIHPEEEHEWVYETCLKNPNIFLHLKPIPDSLECIHLLWDEFEIYFLSTPMWGVPESFSDKRKWLEKYFGNNAIDRLILTRRKDLCIGDYLIDDRIKNGVDKFKGKHIHYATEQFPNWITVYDFLIKTKQQ